MNSANAQLIDIYQKLKETNLRPNEYTNQLFSDLVTLAKSNTYKLSNISEITSIQKLCAQGEYELEKYWSELIINDKCPEDKLKEFTYYDNYLKLAQLEYSLINSCIIHNTHKYLFVGGGPLPLSAIILAKNFNTPVHILERDQVAYNLSLSLIRHLNLDKLIKITLGDALTFEEYTDYNVIFLAALVGMTSKSKKEILNHIHTYTHLNTHLLVRGSWGNRQLLYPNINLDEIPFDPIIELHPHNEIINSIYILAKNA